MKLPLPTEKFLLRQTKFFLHIKKFLLHIKKFLLRITNFVLHITNFVLHIKKFLLRITKFVLHITKLVLHVMKFVTIAAKKDTYDSCGVPYAGLESGVIPQKQHKTAGFLSDQELYTRDLLYPGVSLEIHHRKKGQHLFSLTGACWVVLQLGINSGRQNIDLGSCI